MFWPKCRFYCGSYERHWLHFFQLCLNPHAMTLSNLLLLLVVGYVVTVCIEIPILYIGLSARHRRSDRIINGLLLTALTYPVVVMVIPATLTVLGVTSHWVCLAISETFAPIAEILFFRYLVQQPLQSKPDLDAAIIVSANLASFLVGEAGAGEWINTLINGNG